MCFFENIPNDTIFLFAPFDEADLSIFNLDSGNITVFKFATAGVEIAWYGLGRIITRRGLLFSFFCCLLQACYFFFVVGRPVGWRQLLQRLELLL